MRSNGLPKKFRRGKEPLAAVEGPRSGGERSEPERRGPSTAGALETARDSPVSEVESDGNLSAEAILELENSTPDPEVVGKPVRRRFTAKYKLEILKAADSCRAPGEIGSLLRKEGLYTSHLSAWRKQREAGSLAALGSRRGRKKRDADPLERKAARLEAENRRLEKKLADAELIIEVQGKVAQLLGISLDRRDGHGGSK